MVRPVNTKLVLDNETRGFLRVLDNQLRGIGGTDQYAMIEVTYDTLRRSHPEYKMKDLERLLAMSTDPNTLYTEEFLKLRAKVHITAKELLKSVNSNYS